VEGAHDHWRHKIALPAKRPFREAKIRIDAEVDAAIQPDPALLELLQDATEVREMAMDSVGHSLHQIARREGKVPQAVGTPAQSELAQPTNC
jgi:hypothetical protein